MVKTTKKVELEPTYIEVSSLLEKITTRELRIKKYKKIIGLLPNSAITITYKDLCANTEKNLNRIAKFMKVGDSGVSYKSDLKKLAKEHIKRK